MPRVSLTDRFVAGAKPDVSGRTDYFDSVTTGLALRVTNTHRSWTFNFTSPKDNKRARLTMGSYPAVPLTVARRKALEAKALVQEGKDPRNVFAAQQASALTVAGLIDSYLQNHARPNLRSAKQMEARFARNVTPLIGAMTLADLHRRDTNTVLDTIVEREKPTMARIVFQDMRAMLRWAVARGDLDRSPLEGASSPRAERPRERVLTNEEIAAVWKGLSISLAKSKAWQRIIKLCLLTAQRVGEVSGMRVDELDLVKSTWALPGSRTKNGHPHTVPLSNVAVGVIKEAIAATCESQFVFPADPGGSLPPMAVARTIGRAHETSEERPKGRFGIDHFTAHELPRLSKLLSREIQRVGSLEIPQLKTRN